MRAQPSMAEAKGPAIRQIPLYSGGRLHSGNQNPVEMAMPCSRSDDFNLKNAGLAACWLECSIAGSGR